MKGIFHCVFHLRFQLKENKLLALFITASQHKQMNGCRLNADFQKLALIKADAVA